MILEENQRCMKSGNSLTINKIKCFGIMILMMSNANKGDNTMRIDSSLDILM